MYEISSESSKIYGHEKKLCQDFLGKILNRPNTLSPIFNCLAFPFQSIWLKFDQSLDE